MDALHFNSLPLNPLLIQVAEELGFEKLSPIQAASMPLLLSGKDVLGQAQTGSGKTVAFAMPILHQLDLESSDLQALIICPTRELALQVTNEVRRLGRKLAGLQVVSLIGGQPGRDQIKEIEKGAHVIVGTPGRIIDIYDRQALSFDSLKFLVLDEADKMLELGFEAEIRALIQVLPTKRQTALFSATFPESILGLSRSFQKNATQVKIESSEETLPQIEQWAYEVEPTEKVEAVLRVLQQHPSNSTIIFCNMKNSVQEISDLLTKQNVSSAYLHGDLDQRERERVMTLFRNGSHRILVATDIAARGLDVDTLELVINFDLPHQPETYVHRIGRTGRAGRSGVSVSLATPREGMRLQEIEKLTKTKFQKQKLGFKNQWGLTKDLKTATMQTLSISGGRKDKLRPGDILGALTGEAGGLPASAIGKIEVQDHVAFVAIATDRATEAFERLRAGRIKGKKFQIKMV